MKTFNCLCGNTLYFENSRCLSCGADVGWCPACRSITTLQPEPGETGIPAADSGLLRCGSVACGVRLVKCHNYAVEHVCNRCVHVTSEADESAATSGMLCDCCIYNDTIPDLSVEGNREKWARLEAAKRRLFFNLDLLGLPRGTAQSGFSPPLAFDFKADVIPANEFWRIMSRAFGKEAGERVYTGHANGKITINIREADPVERESLRVDLDEAHRTLIGHFRHEIGHYYWDLLVAGKCEAACVQVFGNHEESYADALDRHYQNGAPDGWQANYISAYATMHPWEDFAETFAAYVEMISVLHTADSVGLATVPDIHSADLESMVAAAARLGIALNEMNRTMGLLDFLPEVIVPAVVVKMQFVHELVRGNVPGEGDDS